MGKLRQERNEGCRFARSRLGTNLFACSGDCIFIVPRRLSTLFVSTYSTVVFVGKNIQPVDPRPCPIVFKPRHQGSLRPDCRKDNLICQALRYSTFKERQPDNPSLSTCSLIVISSLTEPVTLPIPPSFFASSIFTFVEPFHL